MDDARPFCPRRDWHQRHDAAAPALVDRSGSRWHGNDDGRLVMADPNVCPYWDRADVERWFGPLKAVAGGWSGSGDPGTAAG
jgi:hypothetical protein